MKASMTVLLPRDPGHNGLLGQPSNPRARESSFATVHKIMTPAFQRRGECHRQCRAMGGRLEGDPFEFLAAAASSRHRLRQGRPRLAAMGVEPDACWSTEIAEILAMKESLTVRVLEKRCR